MLYPPQERTLEGSVILPVMVYRNLLVANITKATAELDALTDAARSGRPPAEGVGTGGSPHVDRATVAIHLEKMRDRLKASLRMSGYGSVTIDLATAYYLDVDFEAYRPMYQAT